MLFLPTFTKKKFGRGFFSRRSWITLRNARNLSIQNCSQFPLLATVELGLLGAAKSPQSSKSERPEPETDWFWFGFTEFDNGGGAAKSPNNRLSTSGCCCLITELSLIARLPPETEVGSLLPVAEAPPGGGGKTTPPTDPLVEAALGRLVAPPVITKKQSLGFYNRSSATCNH